MTDMEQTIRGLRDCLEAIESWTEGVKSVSRGTRGKNANALTSSIHGFISDDATSETTPRLLDTVSPSLADDLYRRLDRLHQEAILADEMVESIEDWCKRQLEAIEQADASDDARAAFVKQVQCDAKNNVVDVLHALHLKGQAVAAFIRALIEAFEQRSPEDFVHPTDRTPNDIACRFGYTRTAEDVSRLNDLAEKALWCVRGLCELFRAHETAHGPTEEQCQWMAEACQRYAETLVFPDSLTLPHDTDEAFDASIQVIAQHRMWRMFQGEGPDVALLPTDQWAVRSVVHASYHDFFAECAVSPVRLAERMYPSAHSAAISGLKSLWEGYEQHTQVVRARPSQRETSWERILKGWGSWEIDNQVQHAFTLLAREQVESQRRFDPEMAGKFDEKQQSNDSERLILDQENNVATLDGSRRPLTPDQFKYVQALAKARGGWVASSQIGVPGQRIDRIRRKLPEHIKRVIETRSGPGGGHRLTIYDGND